MVQPFALSSKLARPRLGNIKLLPVESPCNILNCYLRIHSASKSKRCPINHTFLSSSRLWLSSDSCAWLRPLFDPREQPLYKRNGFERRQILHARALGSSTLLLVLLMHIGTSTT
ncbi:hypothetical protein B0H12DRAFT_1139133 [Mycena haematopus]|nr:hypothetical protein B0H12DRAFT_1139133 [Mycena haematopus]